MFDEKTSKITFKKAFSKQESFINYFQMEGQNFKGGNRLFDIKNRCNNKEFFHFFFLQGQIQEAKKQQEPPKKKRKSEEFSDDEEEPEEPKGKS